VPLLALLHGARRGEIMQLYVRDVFQDEETGTWAFRFDRDGGKSIKTASSVRQTPLHPVFVELGFLAFVEERRRLVGGEGSLWQGFEDRSKLSSRVNKWGEWFGRYLAANVVKADGKAFHSFRATFKRFGHDCHVPEPVLDRLVGHVVPGVGARYGRKRDASGRRDSGFPIQRLAREISRVRFRGVDFGKIV
jgi:integrase